MICALLLINNLNLFILTTNCAHISVKMGPLPIFDAIQSLLKLDWRVSILCGLLIGQTLHLINKTFHLPKHKPGNVVSVGKATCISEPVAVYVFRGSGQTVSSSPFSTKIISYMRLAGIPHIVHLADPMKAPKKKVPYIVHDGNTIGDSQLIIRYLENTFNVRPMAKQIETSKEYGTLLISGNPFVPFDDLSPENRATSDMVRLLCEQELYWGLVSCRWFGEQGIGKSEILWKNTIKSYFMDIPAFIRPTLTSMIRASLWQDAWGQGLVRHSPDDQIYLTKRALSALNITIGDKRFVLGAFPAECDCIVFGTLQSLLDDSNWPNVITEFIKEDCKNLVRYMITIRKDLFADMPPGTLLPPSRADYHTFSKLSAR